MSASLVPPTELSPEMEAILGVESRPEPMLVVVTQEKLLEKLNLDGLAHWSPGNAAAVRELVFAYHDVFTLEGNKLGCTSAIEHEIRIENSALQGVVSAYTSTLVRGGACFTPGYAESGGDSSKPITMVQCGGPGQEEGRTLRFCVDFRRLNTWTKKDSYPLPCIQEVLESMAGSAHFSSMDFKSGFWQIKMAPESQQYTTFMVGNLRFYEFTHMPFGLCKAPATFQHLMRYTLGELNLTCCVVYLDDVIIFGCTEQECLHIVFERFQEFNLRLKPSKCSFFQLEIVYLAHHISW